MAMGYIGSVQLNPEDGYITINGGLDEYYSNNEDFVFPDTLWINKDLPITHEKVYRPKKEN